jgi:hypothetical protein
MADYIRFNEAIKSQNIPEIIRLHQKNGKNIILPSIFLQPVFLAATQGYVSSLHKLLELGYDPDTKSQAHPYNATPMTSLEYLACIVNDQVKIMKGKLMLECVLLLAKFGATVPEIWRVNIPKIVMARKMKNNIQMYEQFLEAIRNQDTQKMIFFHTLCVNDKIKAPRGYLDPLFFAATRGFSRSLELLLRMKYDSDVKDISEPFNERLSSIEWIILVLMSHPNYQALVKDECILLLYRYNAHIPRFAMKYIMHISHKNNERNNEVIEIIS